MIDIEMRLIVMKMNGVLFVLVCFWCGGCFVLRDCLVVLMILIVLVNSSD